MGQDVCTDHVQVLVLVSWLKCRQPESHCAQMHCYGAKANCDSTNPNCVLSDLSSLIYLDVNFDA